MFKESAWGNVFLVFAPFALGFFMWFSINAALYSHFFVYLSWALYASGFILFVSAKGSVIKKGKFFTFGASLMMPQSKKVYKAGYLLMILAFFLTLSLLFGAKILAGH